MKYAREDIVGDAEFRAGDGYVGCPGGVAGCGILGRRTAGVDAIDERLGNSKSIFANFVLDAGTILADAVRPNRATVLEVKGFGRCGRAAC